MKLRKELCDFLGDINKANYIKGYKGFPNGHTFKEIGVDERLNLFAISEGYSYIITSSGGNGEPDLNSFYSKSEGVYFKSNEFMPILENLINQGEAEIKDVTAVRVFSGSGSVYDCAPDSLYSYPDEPTIIAKCKVNGKIGVKDKKLKLNLDYKVIDSKKCMFVEDEYIQEMFK